jgi:hypothetical protein
VAALIAAGIPFEWLQEDRGKRRFTPRLCVAMTRAMDELVLTYCRESAFAARVGEVCGRVAA